MARISSYLNYLPPVLWETSAEDTPEPRDDPEKPDTTTEFSINTFLLGFEKLLTGLDDDVDIWHGEDDHGHRHPSIAATIAAIPRLFDPWHTPAGFLPWLASWVALDFPTLQGKPLWDEYQQRKATADIARIHRRRGLKEGLNLSLDLFSVINLRPRVAIDDGNKLLTTTPARGALAPVTALVTQGPTLAPPPITTASSVLVNGLVRPQCIAASGDGHLFAGDFGAADTVSALRSRVWRLDSTGASDTAGTPPVPRPLVPGTALTDVVAVAVAPPAAGRPETLYFVDGNKKLFSLPAPYTADAAADPVTLPTDNPVAMAIDHNGDVLVLDRGNIAGQPARPKIVVVRPGAAAAPEKHALPTVIEPLSLFIRGDALIVGDGGNQDERQPGNLAQVQRSAAASWPADPLLSTDPALNPLISPTAVVAADNDAVFVLDAGLRPFPTRDLVLAVARPAAVWRVELGAETPTVTPVTQNGNLVFPTGMASVGGRLVICDPGQLEPGQLEPLQQRPVLSRLLPFRFCVVVHFEAANLPEDEQDRTRALGRISASIRRVVDDLRPAHTLPTLIIAG